MPCGSRPSYTTAADKRRRLAAANHWAALRSPFYKRTPCILPPLRMEAPLVSTGCAHKSRHVKACENVFAGCSRVESLSVRGAINEETEQGKEGEDSIGVQHVGTGMGLGRRV